MVGTAGSQRVQLLRSTQYIQEKTPLLWSNSSHNNMLRFQETATLWFDDEDNEDYDVSVAL